MVVLRLCSSVGLSGKADLSQLMRWMHSLLCCLAGPHSLLILS